MLADQRYKTDEHVLKDVTDAIYLEDPYVREFEATVERVLGTRVVLDRTAFYPEGGGQPAEGGVLRTNQETLDVIDVKKKDSIYHELDGDPPAEGTTITGELDWERRYAHMRYHTAQHLLSALLLEDFDAETTGNQLYADRARIDCAYDRFDGSDLERIETRVNELIDRDMPVRWYEMDREDAEERLDPERTRLDLLPDSITTVRIVEIDDYDRTACAGTHVQATGEIGEFAIEGRETKGSGEERLSFVLGDRG